MISGAWLDAYTPTSLAMARPRRGGGPGGPHFSQEFRFGHAGNHEVEAQKVRIDPWREECHVVALDRGAHLWFQWIPVEDLLPVGAVLFAERSRTLKIEEELAQPVVSHGRYFATSKGGKRNRPKRRARTRLFPAALSGEGHESHRQGLFCRGGAVRPLFNEQELLNVGGSSHRDHHPPAGLELVDQGPWNLRGCCSDDNRIEGRSLRPAAVAVADPDLDVAVAELAEEPLRLFSERLDDLDRVDLRRELGEHRRLVTRARAHLQHLVS